MAIIKKLTPSDTRSQSSGKAKITLTIRPFPSAYFGMREYHESRKAPSMSTILQLGNSTVSLKDDEFGNRFQTGYLRFKADFQEKPISENAYKSACRADQHVNSLIKIW
jgi:hypothetical protein